VSKTPIPEKDTRSADAIAIDIEIRLGFLGLFLYWSLSVVAPFLSIVLWAVILAAAIYPVHQWLAARLGGREKLASALITFAGLAIIFGPAAALAASLFHTVQTLIGGLQDGSLTMPAPPESLREWPVVGDRLDAIWSQAVTNLDGLLVAHRDFILDAGGSLLGRVARAAGGVLSIGVSVVIAGFLYRHGPALAGALRAFARRIVAERGEGFVDLAGSTVRCEINLKRAEAAGLKLSGRLSSVARIVRDATRS